MVRKLQRVIEHTTAEERTVGNVYAVAFVCSLNGHRSKMLAALWRVICRDLKNQHSWTSTASAAEHETWERQTDLILQHTHKRQQETFGHKRGTEGVNDTCGAIKRNLNGNPALRRVAHYCNQLICSCKSEKDRRQLVFASVVPVMPFTRSELPSINRWGSCRNALADIVGGCMLNGLLGRL